MAQILLPKLNEFVLYQEVVFGTAANVLQPDDVETIQKLALPRKTSTTRQLFFPVEDDFDDEGKKLCQFEGVRPTKTPGNHPQKNAYFHQQVRPLKSSSHFHAETKLIHKMTRFKRKVCCMMFILV